MTNQYDFSESQMECDDVLIALGLAHRAVDLNYPGDGEVTVYEAPPQRSDWR